MISPAIQLLFWLLLLCLSCHYFVDSTVCPFNRRKYIRKPAEKAMATVIDYKIDTDVDGIQYYFPVMAFKDKTGKSIVVDAEIGRNYKPEEGNQRFTICLMIPINFNY